MFISFALGLPPRGTRAYASDLARKLRERDFTVFFSEDEAPAGSELDVSLKRALRRSKILVVVANRESLREPRWIRAEVEGFRRRHPERAIVPISVDGALLDSDFSPDDRLIAAGGRDHDVMLWDRHSGALIASAIKGHSGGYLHGLHTFAFSPDGKLLATGGRDRKIFLWDTGTGKQVGEPLVGHGGAAEALAFSPVAGCLPPAATSIESLFMTCRPERHSSGA